MRSHITTINRLYVQLERIIHGNHSEDAQKCFREVTKAADCAINLCYFFENWKEKDITDNKYVTDYYKKYKSALWARAMFLNIQESKLNMILYKNMSLAVNCWAAVVVLILMPDGVSLSAHPEGRRKS